MTRAQTLFLVMPCVLLAAWLTGARSGVRGNAAPPPPESTVVSDAALTGITEQASRLRTYLSVPGPLTPQRRNPFRFGEIAPSVSPSRRRAPALTTTPAERPQRPEMKLLGIAEDGADGRTVRTAIVSARGQLFFLKEGERLLLRFEVLRVVGDAVQLKDAEGGAVFTIALR